MNSDMTDKDGSSSASAAQDEPLDSGRWRDQVLDCDFDSVIASRTASLERDPTDASKLADRGFTHLWRGQVLRQLREDPRASYRSAIKDLTAMLRLGPDGQTDVWLGDAHVGLGDAERRRGIESREHYKTAYRCYRRAMRRRCAKRSAHEGLGDVYMRFGRPDLAVPEYTMGCRGAGKSLDPFQKLLLAKRQAREMKEAGISM